MERISRVIFVIFIGLILTIYGCSSWPRKTETAASASLELSALLKFDDVPIPNGFKFLPQKSFAFQNDLFRVAMLRYAGKATAEQVVSFYKEQMPLFRWDLLNIVEYGTKTLNFERPDETCTILIESKGSSSRIAISVAPKSRPPRPTSNARTRVKIPEKSLK
jgi:hypothetical protein